MSRISTRLRKSKNSSTKRRRLLIDPLERRDMLAVIISEVHSAGSGNGTYGADWFEVTNTYQNEVNISGWKMDDSSNSFASAVALRGLTSIPAGKSAIFLEGNATGTTDSAIISNFSTAWFGNATPPAGLVYGFYGGSGVGLGTSGDAVNLFDAVGNRIAGVSFGNATASKTFDNLAGLGSKSIPLPEVSKLSVAGVNSAFVSSNGAETGSPGRTITTVDLSTYVRVGRYDLPEPTRTAAPTNSLLAQEVSAVTYNWDTDTLFVVGDGGTSVVQVTKTGQLVDSMTLAPGSSPQGTEFYDPEGLTYVGNGKFVMSEERDRQAVLFTYAAGTTLIRANTQTLQLGTFIGNIGIEGISYDPQTLGFIAVKEVSPQGIFQTGIDFDAGTATNGSPTTVNSIDLFNPSLLGLLDLADVFALSNLSPLNGRAESSHLLALSQESGKIVNVDRVGNIYSSLTIVSDPGNPLTVPAQQHEGLTMDSNGFLYVVSENGGGDFDHPQLWVYAPSSAPNQAPTAIALNNQLNAILENTSTATRIKVADVAVTDDGLGTNNLTVTGPDAAFFEVDSNGLYIKAGTVLDYETKASYSVTVNVDDPTLGSTPDASAPFSLTVLDVTNEVPVLPSIIISEVAPWSSGNSNLGADWFEVTNTGASPVNISGWKMDDNSNSFGSAVALNGITSIAPGESVIFIESSNPAVIASAFKSIWFGANAPASLQIGTYSGGGVGLSTGGDAVNLYDSSGALQANVSFGASPTGPFTTFNNALGLNNAIISLPSVVGVNGAFKAATDVNEIGSPGSVGKLFISEVAPWSSGNSPIGADWFEVTNTTAFSVDLTGWKMDDSSESFAAAVSLNGISSIAPGESVIFIETGDLVGTSALFRSTWFGVHPPAALQIGSYSGGGVGLSTGGDAVNLFNTQGVLQAKVFFGAAPAGPFPSFENAGALNGVGIPQLSVPGVNGAFKAINDVNEIGSPGTVTYWTASAQPDSFDIPLNAPAQNLPVLINDSPIPGGNLGIVNITQPAHGVVTIKPDGAGVTYQPTGGYTGPDSFSYTVSSVVQVANVPREILSNVQGVNIYDGYGSGLTPVPGQNDEFYTITDRGPNVAATPISSLSNSIGTADSQLTIAFNKSFPSTAAFGSFSIRIDSETMTATFATATANTITLNVTRSAPVSHNAGASVTLSGVLAFPMPDFTPQIGRYKLVNGTLTKVGNITLKDSAGNPLNGLPNKVSFGGTGEIAIDFNGNFIDTSNNVNGIDAEGIVALADGTFWISDEYGPYVTHFDASGKMIEQITPFGVNAQGHQLPQVMAKRRPNRGMEGLTVTPDGSTLVGMMQSPLINDITSSDTGRTTAVRILTYDLTTGATKQYLYLLDDPTTFAGAVSEIVAVSNTTFQVIERDGLFPGDASSPAKLKKIYEFSITGATDVGVANIGTDTLSATKGLLIDGTTTIESYVKNLNNADALTKLTTHGIVPVSKTLKIDLLTDIGDASLLYPHDKVEGLALINGGRTLVISNDDDFGVVPGATPGSIASKYIPTLPGTPVDFTQLLFVDLYNLHNPNSTATATVSLDVKPLLPNGVAAGDVTQNSAVLWTHSLTTGPVTFEISTDPKLIDPLTGTATASYVVPSGPAASLIQTRALLTVGDEVPHTDGAGTYRMVGIPDGMGAFDNGDGTFTLLVNQELGNTAGAIRDHGSAGSFVSRFVIDKTTLRVISGQDQIQSLRLWDPALNGGSGGYYTGISALNRLCSADLPEISAFFNAATGLGTSERIFMNGEESGAEGRAFGVVVTGADAGVAFQLPALGRFSHENSVANPFPQDKTIVAGLDDTTPGQVYFYVGTKTNSGTVVEKAGLTNGKLYGLKVAGVPSESRTNGLGTSSFATQGTFSLADLGQVANQTGAQIQTASVNAGVTEFLRPEDGAWDPNHPNDFYFVTTDAFGGRSRLYRAHFTDISNPELGGTIEMLLTGTEGQEMFDNITIDRLGRVLLQEDVGNQARLGKIWAYSIAGDTLVEVASHNATFFQSGGAQFLTQDEEASGIIDVSSILGPGKFLFDVQGHYSINSSNPRGFANPNELVEGGQLMLLELPTVLPIGSTTAATYLTPLASGVSFTGLLTAGDQVPLSAGETIPQLNGVAADVNRDSNVTPLDLVLVVNYLNAFGSSTAAQAANETQAVLDVNADNYVSPLDALLVVIALNSGGSTSSGLVSPSARATVPNQMYTLNGTPDGIGAFDNGDGTFTMLIDHEFAATAGVVRAHGSTGSYVSRLILDKSTLQVLQGKDQDEQVFVFDATANGGAGGYVNVTRAFERFCSGDLPSVTAFYNAASGMGTTERIFLNGEETRPPFSTAYGSAWAHVVTGPDNGQVYELPWMGKMSFENLVANPYPQDKTLVIAGDDSTNAFSTTSNPSNPPSELYLYVGVKKNTGNAVERAGLTGGNLFGIKVNGITNEDNLVSGSRFGLNDMGNVAADTTGVALSNNSIAAGVLQFRRIEDGAWDPSHPRDYYFVTTDSFAGNSKLFRLRFDDLTNPTAGGTIEVMLDGTEGQRMFDNLTIDQHGRVLLQEDVGNNAHLGKIWAYDIATDGLTLLAQHNPDLFLSGSPNFITQDEESSGIIDVSSILGDGKFLLDVQAHKAAPGSLVEGGQLLVMDISGLNAPTNLNVEASVTDPTLPVKVNVPGLQPSTTYYYRVTDQGGAVGTGSFKTSAANDIYAGLHFGVSGDQRGELAPYPAISNADDARLDFFAHLGDSIYADFPSPDLPAGQAQSLADYRVKNNEVYFSRYGQNTLADLRGTTAWMGVIDDHEVTNDFAGGASAASDPRFGSLPAGTLINDAPLFENGVQAFQEYNPLADNRYGETGDPVTANEVKQYRYQTYGKDAATFLLDTRSFRSPELAPVQDITNPSQIGAFLAASLNPSRTLLGSQQFADLKNDLLAAQSAGTTWKFIMTPEPISNFGVLAAEDRWEGYAAERNALLKFIDDNQISNVVFVAADFHGSLVNSLSYQAVPGGPQVQTKAIEIVTGPVAFDKPFGPTIIDLATQAGLIDGATKAAYNAGSAAVKEQIIAGIINGGLAPLGYNPFSPTANPLPNVSLTQGQFMATNSFGWTDFSIDPQTQQLVVTTYGIDPYSQSELEADPMAIAGRTPQVVGQFVVNPAPHITSVSLQTATLLQGETAVLSGSFTDPSPNEAHTVTIDWGDGSPATIINVPANTPLNAAKFMAIHPYAATGKLKINVAVMDEAGGGDVMSVDVVVAEKVTSQVNVQRTGPTLNRRDNLYYSNLTITNTSANAIGGGFRVELTNLTPSVKLDSAQLNLNGTIINLPIAQSAIGERVLVIPKSVVASLSAGQTLPTITLKLKNTLNKAITFSTELFSNPFEV